MEEIDVNRIAVIYASIHHKNTERVAKFIAQQISAELFDIMRDEPPSQDSYEILILASGIYFGEMNKKLRDYVAGAIVAGKKVILCYTCGMNVRDYTKSMKSLLKSRGSVILGSVGCRGYDTYGLFAKLGGIAKGRPNEADMHKLVEKIQMMIKESGTD